MIGRFARRMPVSLADLAQQYLAQPLPDISGIFQPRADTPVEEDTVEETVPGITPQLLQPVSGGGDSFSVYNPDPTRTRTIKDYRFPFKFTGEDLPEAGDYISPPTGIRSLLSKLPGQQILQGIAGMLPVNRRAILENQLLGGDFMLDDIGRIVTNNYNTPEGIMAGYNAAQMDASTFDDRIAKIQETINKKTAANPNYDPSNLLNRIDLINQAKDIFLGAKKSSRVIEDQKLRDKGLTPLSDQIAMNQAKSDFQQLVDEGEEEQELLDFLRVTDPKAIPTGITAASFPGVGLNRRDIIQDIGIQNVRDAIDRGRERERQKQIQREQMAKKKRDIQQYTGGGGGNNNSGGGGGPSYSGMGSIGSGGVSKTSQGVTSAQHSAFRN